MIFKISYQVRYVKGDCENFDSRNEAWSKFKTDEASKLIFDSENGNPIRLIKIMKRGLSRNWSPESIEKLMMLCPALSNERSNSRRIFVVYQMICNFDYHLMTEKIRKNDPNYWISSISGVWPIDEVHRGI